MSETHSHAHGYSDDKHADLVVVLCQIRDELHKLRKEITYYHIDQQHPEPDVARTTSVLLDVRGVADYLGITERMARRLFDDRAYPVVKVGRRVYVKRTDLDDYIKKQGSK